MKKLLTIILLALLVLLVPLLPNKLLAQQQLNLAVIANVSTGGVGPVNYSQGTNGLNAQIGRWDTPYPYGLNGPRLPGAESLGESILYIDVDVKDGGKASFSYSYKTYDAGIYDWYEISLVTPSGTRSLTPRLGKPGSDYGTLFESASASLSVELSQWRNQRVRFIFSVRHDGWGDQTQGKVLGFALRTCDVPPLVPLTDPSALNFENGNTVDTANLVPEMLTALTCVTNKVAEAGGTLTVNSAFRPPEYQAHLREVWDKRKLLKDNNKSECQSLKATVSQEFTRHGLLSTQRPAASSRHTEGQAIDISSTLSQARLVELASQCNLNRPLPENDPVHYILR